MKAKVRSIYAIICLITVVFFCILACDNGSVSDSSAAKSSGLVNVSLTVDEKTSSGLQKSISISSDIDLNTLTYQYSAEPLWTGTNIQGTTNGFVTIVYDAGMSIGYFTSGMWQFNVRILKGGTIIYTGSTNVNISSSNVSVNVIVSKMVNDNPPAGSVRINITAPTVDGEELNISYTGGSDITIDEDDDIDGDGNKDGHISWSKGITTFDYTVSNLPVGRYTFTLAHSAGGSGATVAVDLRPGEGAVIEGHLDNGVWQVGCITVKIHTIFVIKNEYGDVKTNVTSAASGDLVSVYAVPVNGSSCESVRISWVDNNDVSHISDPLVPNGFMYTFVMPDNIKHDENNEDRDVIVTVQFTELDNTDIDVSHFRAIFQIIHGKHSDAIAFGREGEAPTTAAEIDSSFDIKHLKLWYRARDKKICWYSQIPTVKFKEGSLANLFKNFTLFKSISMVGFNTSEITSMASMFQGCSSLETLELPNNFNAGKAIDLSYMFEGCKEIEDLNLSGFTVNTVTNGFVNMAGMFKNCEKLYCDEGVLDLSSFNTSRVNNMSYMFFACYRLKEIVFGNNFNTGNVVNMACMFAGWDSEVLHPMSLTTLNVANFDTSKVKYMQYMFYQCKDIASLDVSGWNTGLVEDMSYMFAGLNEGYGTSLNHLRLTNWNFSSVKTTNRMFDRCQSLSDLTFPDEANFKSLETMTYMFSHCTALTPTVFKAIVGTWTFAEHSNYPDSIYGNSDTSMFGNYQDNNKGSNNGKNYIFRDTMTKSGNNFADRHPTDDEGNEIEYFTKDKVNPSKYYQLYIGGHNGNSSSAKYQRLTTKKNI